MNELEIIKQKIYVIRGKEVMLARDIAKLYEVKTSRINEQAKRNPKNFPERYMFQLSDIEFADWKSQNAISNSDKMGLRVAPYAFTQTGVAMLSSVLKNDKAIDINIKIMDAFIEVYKSRQLIYNVTPAIEDLFKSFDLKDSKIVISNNPNMQININNPQKGNISIINTVSETSVKKELKAFADAIGQTTMDQLKKERISSDITDLIKNIEETKDNSLISKLIFNIKDTVSTSLTGILSSTLITQLNKIKDMIELFLG